MVQRGALNLVEQFGLEAPENAAVDWAESLSYGLGWSKVKREALAEDIWEQYLEITE